MMRTGLSVLIGLLSSSNVAGLFNSFTQLQQSHRHYSRKFYNQSHEPHYPWSLYQTISGFDFFDSFVFINRWDNTTHSASYYVNKEQAQDLSLAYVDENARAIIAVDSSVDISNDTMPAVVLNTTTGTFKYNPKALRKSVRLESLERHDAGTLVIADFQHVPFGCATWPAFWLFGTDWPNNGEIDIFEGWNDNSRGRATLHTLPNCSHDALAEQTGKVLQATCDSSVNWNAGCSVEDPTTEFYGPPFNKQGGGVFAAMYTNKEISIWRWLRKDIPADIQADRPVPESWPTPVATWLSGKSCSLNHRFGPQNLIINIATCGDSDLNTYSQGNCPGKCYDHLLKGANYKDAYFAINSIQIFKGRKDAVSRPHKVNLNDDPL